MQLIIQAFIATGVGTYCSLMAYCVPTDSRAALTDILRPEARNLKTAPMA